MSGRNRPGAGWQHATVILRPDIYRLACERGIDISDACNRALAGLTGCEYTEKPQNDPAPPPPVIIAKNGAVPDIPAGPRTAPQEKMHPVINADDPAAPARVVQAKTRPEKKAPAETPATVPAAGPVPAKERTAPAAAGRKTAASQKGRGAPARKQSKGDALKAFFAAHIARTGDTADHVAKDELYSLFTRFCRDHRIAPVPERRTITVALKNQFAVTEKNVDGIPSWTGIRLK